MRLRTRLALGFALLALVPLALVVPLALERLRATLHRELAARVEGAQRSAQEALERSAQEVQRALEELVASDAFEDLALGGAVAGEVAGELMESRGLSVLSLFDARGITLSSGHLPARRGDPDPVLFALTRAATSRPRPMLIEVRSDAGLKRLPALVAARRRQEGDATLWAVGGVLLDDALLSHLARLTQAEVSLEVNGAAVSHAGAAPPPHVERTLRLSEEVGLRLVLSREAAREAEAGVARAFVLLAASGLGLSVLLGLFLARRITRPVEALTRGARAVTEGAQGVQVQVAATGEVGTLVTAFNRMTSELRATTEKLIASERVAAWQEVAKRLAHEIKNPLTPIQMSLETLLAAHDAKDPRFLALFPESAGVVLEEVERLRKIVDEFSRFARLPKPVLERLALDELAESVIALYGSTPEGLDLQDSLERGVAVLADRDQLTQVLVNLVKNAEEAMPQGGTIRVRVRGTETEGIMEVEDTGAGLTPELRPRIFEPYFTTKANGTGLGLAIAARILHEHGGRLEVDDAPGTGACFRLTLPRFATLTP